MGNASLGLYERALAGTGRIVSGVREEHLDAPTPCSDFDVRALLAHMVGFLEVVAAGGLDGAVHGPGRSYATAGRAALSALSAPGALDLTWRLRVGEVPGTITLGIALIEAVVHGWDLARATGQPATVDPAAAEAALAFGRTIMVPQLRERAFAPAVPVPPDAPAGDRLLAFLGRQP